MVCMLRGSQLLRCTTSKKYDSLGNLSWIAAQKKKMMMMMMMILMMMMMMMMKT